MANVTVGGVATRYEVAGAGPPLLMFSPGGFDATIEKWSTLGIYATTRPLHHLTQRYRCILFDRRECGQSGGVVERVTWGHYVAQAKGLLDYLGIARAHLMGGCMGCSPAAAFAVAHPEAVLGMVLYWPVGGPRYRINGQRRFNDHLAFAGREGLGAVVALVRETGAAFGADPRGGPWASAIKSVPGFADSYALIDPERYRLLVTAMARGLFDRDTAPGAEPEELMCCAAPTLIIPGKDTSHATSAARYFEECLPQARYWDAAVADQTEAATSERLLEFLAAVKA